MDYLNSTYVLPKFGEIQSGLA